MSNNTFGTLRSMLSAHTDMGILRAFQLLCGCVDAQAAALDGLRQGNRLVSLTAFSTFNQEAAGSVDVDPNAVAAVVEVKPRLGFESRSRIKLTCGEWIDVCEDPERVRKMIGR